MLDIVSQTRLKFSQARRSGQSLVELLVAIAVGILMIAAAVGVIVPVLKGNTDVAQSQVAGGLAKELLENTRVWSESNWNDFLANTSPGSQNHFYLTTASSPFASQPGEETVTVSLNQYTRYAYRENVYRDGSGNIVEATPGTLDQGTAKITIVIEGPSGLTRNISSYIARTHDTVYLQTDWSGGSNETAILPSPNNKFATSSDIDYTSSTGSLYVEVGSGSSAPPGIIDSTDRWAWNDLTAWLDFYKAPSTPGEVKVYSDHLEGYASSTGGILALDCATSPSPASCGFGNWKVLNSGNGLLSGWAWSDIYGWVSFCGGPAYAGVPGCQSNAANISYRVYIDQGGYFHGFAWNDVAGYISFNCNQNEINYCVTSFHRVRTTWRPSVATGTLDSAVFDTGITLGAQFQSMLWRGNWPTGTSVGFQIAVSNASSGPWNFAGPGGDPAVYYNNGADISIPLDYSVRGRYFRYRIQLSSNQQQTMSPRVDDVIVHWSP